MSEETRELESAIEKPNEGNRAGLCEELEAVNQGVSDSLSCEPPRPESQY